MEGDRPDLFDSWESYRTTCRELSHAMANRTGTQVRLAKKTSNLFRSRGDAAAKRLDVRRLSRVIETDPERNIAEVEGMTALTRVTSGFPGQRRRTQGSVKVGWVGAWSLSKPGGIPGVPVLAEGKHPRSGQFPLSEPAG